MQVVFIDRQIRFLETLVLGRCLRGKEKDKENDTDDDDDGDNNNNNNNNNNNDKKETTFQSTEKRETTYASGVHVVVEGL